MIEEMVGVVGILPSVGLLHVRANCRTCASQASAQSDLAQSAFVTRRPPGQKHAGDAVDAFDRAVNPGTIHLPGRTVDPQPGLTIVETGQDHVTPLKQPQTHVHEQHWRLVGCMHALAASER